MLGLPDHLLQDGLLGRHLEKNALVKDIVKLQEAQKEQNKAARCQLGHEQYESPIQHARQTLMPYPKQASTQA